MTAILRLRACLERYAKADSGSVTIDFAIVLPVFLLIMLSSFEAGYTMIRMVMLERALDMTVRDLRIGSMGLTPNHGQVKTQLCAHSSLFPDCERDVKLEMRVIDRVNWSGFTTLATCVDRTTEIQPALTFVQGGSNEIVTIRACAVFDPFFPTTRWGLRMPLDASGAYQIASMSAFVNEPR